MAHPKCHRRGVSGRTLTRWTGLREIRGWQTPELLGRASEPASCRVSGEAPNRGRGHGRVTKAADQTVAWQEGSGRSTLSPAPCPLGTVHECGPGSSAKRLPVDQATEGTARHPLHTAGPVFTSETAGHDTAQEDARASQCPPLAARTRPLWVESASGTVHGRGRHCSFNSVRSGRRPNDLSEDVK